jgi:hypothetical protein
VNELVVVTAADAAAAYEVVPSKLSDDPLIAAPLQVVPLTVRSWGAATADTSAAVPPVPSSIVHSPDSEPASCGGYVPVRPWPEESAATVVPGASSSRWKNRGSSARTALG